MTNPGEGEGIEGLVQGGILTPPSKHARHAEAQRMWGKIYVDHCGRVVRARCCPFRPTQEMGMAVQSYHVVLGSQGLGCVSASGNRGRALSPLLIFTTATKVVVTRVGSCPPSTCLDPGFTVQSGVPGFTSDVTVF